MATEYLANIVGGPILTYLEPKRLQDPIKKLSRSVEKNNLTAVKTQLAETEAMLEVDANSLKDLIHIATSLKEINEVLRTSNAPSEVFKALKEARLLVERIILFDKIASVLLVSSLICLVFLFSYLLQSLLSFAVAVGATLTCMMATYLVVNLNQQTKQQNEKTIEARLKQQTTELEEGAGGGGSSQTPEGVITTASGGRTFEIGGLYDARSDQLVDGLLLWNAEVLKVKTAEDPKGICTRIDNVFSHCELDTGDSFSRTAALLDIDGSLKLSFVCGLVSFQGAAKFLSDKKESKREARVNLIYRSKTHKVTLPIFDERIKNPRIFDLNCATHVVTAIEYGGMAVFTFSQMCSSESEAKRIEGTLKAAINAIPLVGIEMGAGVAKNDEMESIKKTVNCRYSGDFFLETIPTTFEAAQKVIETLPSLVQRNPRPISVTLFPLSKIDNNALRLVRTISSELIDRVASYMDDLENAKVWAKDLASQSDIFLGLKDQLTKFQTSIVTQKTRFQQVLVQILPLIRGGGKEERVLLEYLDQQLSSPFVPEKLFKCLDDRAAELATLLDTAALLRSEGVQVCIGAEKTRFLNSGTLIENPTLVLSLNLDNQVNFVQEMENFLNDKPVIPSGVSWTKTPTAKLLSDQTVRMSKFIKSTFDEGMKPQFLLTCGEVSDPPVRFLLYSPDHQGGPVELPDAPRNISFVSHTANSITIRWETPNQAYYDRFQIKYRAYFNETTVDEWKSLKVHSVRDNSVSVPGLRSNQNYQFRVQVMVEFGCSALSDETLPFSTLQELSCAEKVRKDWCHPIPLAKKVDETFPGDIYQLKLEKDLNYPVCACDKDTKDCLCNPGSECMCIQAFSIGEVPRVVTSSKTLIMVGETGTGKSTWLNGFVNVLFQVKFSDNFRFKLIDDGIRSQHKSQTQRVSVYTLYPLTGVGYEGKSLNDTPLILIDTPGFGDTEGIKKDQKISKLIAAALGGNAATQGVLSTHLSGIGFVVKYSQNRLTVTQKYIFDEILSLFGKDMDRVILPVLTFADNGPNNAIKALHAANVPMTPALDDDGKLSDLVIEDTDDKTGKPFTKTIPHPRTFRFNNAALYGDNVRVPGGKAVTSSDSDSTLHRAKLNSNTSKRFDSNKLNWEISNDDYINFLLAFHDNAPVSLLTTKQGLKERETLQATVAGLGPQVQLGLDKITMVEKQLTFIDGLNEKILFNLKNKEVVLEVPTIEQRKVPVGKCVTICPYHQKTCHFPCSIPDNPGKINCSAMKNGICTVCPDKCSWNKHINHTDYWVNVTKKEKKTVEKFAEEYKVNMNDKNSKFQLMAKMLEELKEIHDKVLVMIRTIRDCTVRLGELVLRPCPLNVSDYIALMIENERREAKEGFLDRIRHLEEAKKTALMIEHVGSGKPTEFQKRFQELRAKIEKVKQADATAEATTEVQGMWARFINHFY